VDDYHYTYSLIHEAGRFRIDDKTGHLSSTDEAGSGRLWVDEAEALRQAIRMEVLAEYKLRLFLTNSPEYDFEIITAQLKMFELEKV